MQNIEKTTQLYEGKAKKVFETTNPDFYIVSYKDDATAFNGKKKSVIDGKGVVNNKMSNYLMQKLNEQGIPTHFVEEISDRETSHYRSVGSYRAQYCGRFVGKTSWTKRRLRNEKTRFGILLQM